jgi:NADPH:quinone reductase
LESGESVLIHAAGSGVGSAAVKLALAIGTRVFATASADKLERVRTLGASATIDREKDFAAVVAEANDRRGVDVVIDFVGPTYFERNVRLLLDGGV